MNAGVPLLLLSWFRYAVHLVLVLAWCCRRAAWALRSVRPREQLVRGASMFLATLMFFTTLSYIPRPRPPPSTSSRRCWCCRLRPGS